MGQFLAIPKHNLIVMFYLLSSTVLGCWACPGLGWGGGSVRSGKAEVCRPLFLFGHGDCKAKAERGGINVFVFFISLFSLLFPRMLNGRKNGHTQKALGKKRKKKIENQATEHLGCDMSRITWR
jgi:hypothetical protein